MIDLHSNYSYHTSSSITALSTNEHETNHERCLYLVPANRLASMLLMAGWIFKTIYDHWSTINTNPCIKKIIVRWLSLSKTSHLNQWTHGKLSKNWAFLWCLGSLWRTAGWFHRWTPHGTTGDPLPRGGRRFGRGHGWRLARQRQQRDVRLVVALAVLERSMVTGDWWMIGDGWLAWLRTGE